MGGPRPPRTTKGQASAAPAMHRSRVINCCCNCYCYVLLVCELLGGARGSRQCELLQHGVMAPWVSDRRKGWRDCM